MSCRSSNARLVSSMCQIPIRTRFLTSLSRKDKITQSWRCDGTFFLGSVDKYASHFFATYKIDKMCLGPTRNLKKSVSFSNINVALLPMILGDHPACQDGPPVELSWEETSCHSFSVEDFEQQRTPYRRHGEQLYLSSLDRSIM